MNFYASEHYLDAVAAVYFKGQRARIEDVQIGDEVLRLLVVNDKRVITRHQFLDFHQPLLETETRGATRNGRYAPAVARRVIERTQWDPAQFPGLELAPYVDWSQFPEYDDYKAYLLKHHKSLVRDRERRGRSLAAAHGELVFTMNDTQADVFDAAQRWKSRQLRDSGLADYFAAPHTMEFLEALRSRGQLVASTLRASGQLLSLWIGFVHDRTWSGWIFTYDPAFRKYSVGHQLLSFMLSESHRLGHREFDFSIGSEDYKMIYATHGRVLGSIGQPPLGQRLIGYAKDELRDRTPKLFDAARNLKKRIDGTLPTQLVAGQTGPAKA
ncbi:GNAT family N-acetyltransferase [Rhodopseudomonas palustris]|uniref:Protein involved in cellulose biosynthesis (CelD)-like n=1 Tax=Rhodopseudomonas palustris (strain BisB18) TaxID=316056 RepID=Q21BK0_RHOPB